MISATSTTEDQVPDIETMSNTAEIMELIQKSLLYIELKKFFISKDVKQQKWSKMIFHQIVFQKLIQWRQQFY